MRRFAFVLAVALLAAPLLHCDARARAIRAELDDADRQLFDRGQQLSSQCWSCHDFYGTQNKVGPYLSGIYGRRAGGASYGGYSEALQRSQLVWDDATLGAFLRDVQGFMPGTSMVSTGVPSAADVRAILFYMKKATAADEKSGSPP